MKSGYEKMFRLMSKNVSILNNNVINNIIQSNFK